MNSSRLMAVGRDKKKSTTQRRGVELEESGETCILVIFT